jgi:hypothetical protein
MGELIGKDYFDDWRQAIDLLNSLGWNLSWKEHESRWHLWTGDKPLFVGDTAGEFQSFVCGVAIGLAVLPDSILEQIRQIANE